jgi:hypothetical protein
MGELYWPFGLAALEDAHMAWAASQVALGRLSADVFSSVVEAGSFEMFLDTGFGYSEAAKVAVETRRNRFGLSHVAGTLRGESIRRLRLDPLNAPAVLRVDWLLVRCWVRGQDHPVDLVLDTADLLQRLALTRCSWLRPKVLVTDSSDPNLELALDELVGGEIYEVRVQCGFAVLLTTAPEPGPHAARKQALKRGLRGGVRAVRSVEARTGLPLERGLRKALGRSE